MKEVLIFAGATGLNTVTDPERIQIQKNGHTDLAAAVNITIDQSGRVNRRKTLELITAGNFHSLFCDKGDAFVVKDTSLYRIGTDFSLQGVRSGLTDAPMAYVQVNDLTYYTNGYELGWINDGISYVWEEGTYTGPTTNRQFSGPMAGSHLAFWQSRMFISEGKFLWWSEPYNADIYNKAESFVQFRTDIRMIKPVAGGVFVSTGQNTWFLEGQNPAAFRAAIVSRFPAYEWSDAVEYVDGFDIGLDHGGLCAMWASPEGAILGLPSGALYNTNKNKVLYPATGTQGFGCLVGYNFIHGNKE